MIDQNASTGGSWSNRRKSVRKATWRSRKSEDFGRSNSRNPQFLLLGNGNPGGGSKSRPEAVSVLVV
ncbi:hypothetical protein [Parafrankia sp. EUN1f]|uniref:hypothetical protein n=1 Tax=Parafrankia sp. EUN1f TaxID=102897 RepID=UPI0012F79BB2|nr:hypothetical protein [Parafrankia sp. EUN1f]